jgi:GTP-binding protein
VKDLARIYVKAGSGGDGSVHFLHGKYQPKGGPDGGDGGKGGSVYLLSDENIENLVPFNYQKKFIIKDGERGFGKKMHGKDTDDLEIHVPVGTVIYEVSADQAEANLRERETFESVMGQKELVVDMVEHGEKFLIAKGGKGGKGNFHFRSSTNQTPMEFEPGKPGEEKWLLLELKVVADVGIVGLPNVGKSSLLKALTNANPKIAGYPFTTLEPNLGVMKSHSGSVILVDVPGVVEDAWEGKGIGPWFLRHLERTKMLMHVLAPSSEILADNRSKLSDVSKQLVQDYKIVRKEFEKYGKGLPAKPEIVVVNKMELVDPELRKEIDIEFDKLIHKSLVWVSAGMGEVGELVAKLG